VKSREAIVKEEKGQRGRTREQRLEKSLELRDFAGLTQVMGVYRRLMGIID
jgi:hypothetical protein